MTLSEWIDGARDVSREQTADIIAQLLALSCGLDGKLSAADISVKFPENGGYCDLLPTGSFESYESGVRPPVYDNGSIPAGNSYVCGLLLYKLLKGSLPGDYDVLVQRAAVAAGGGNAAPVLTAPESPFGELLSALTEISCEKRADALSALDMLASMREGCAVVHIVEEETGVRIERRAIALNTAFTRWKPLDEYIYDGQKFFPADRSERSFPYRAFTLEYVCTVRAARYSEVRETSFIPAAGALCTGIDIGACSTEISFLDENGRVFEKPFEGRISVPSVLAVNAEGAFVFGNEAVKLCEESAAAPIRCFSPGYAHGPDEPVLYAGAGGGTAEVSLRAAVSAYAGFIRRLAERAAGRDKTIAAGFVLPPDSAEINWRDLIDEAVKSFGWSVYYTESVSAASLYFAEAQKNAAGERVMTFDFGESALRAGITAEETLIEAGGGYITRLIAEKLMRDLLAEDIDLSGDGSRRMDPLHAAQARRSVFGAAESIKKRLSFDGSASCVLKLRLNSGENVRRIEMTREELEDIIAPVIAKIGKTVTGALRSENLESGDIRHIFITGGGSLIPSLSGYVRGMFPSAAAHFPHDTVSVSRGAALYACSRRFGTAKSVSETVTADYGIQKITAADGRLRFERLIEAGTEFSVEGNVRIIYRLEAGKNDTDGGSFVMKLYSRPRGMEHVISTLSPENVIKYVGKAEADIPSDYDSGRDAVDFIVSIYADGKITAEAEHMRKPGAFSKLRNRQTRGNMEVVKPLQARFVRV